MDNETYTLSGDGSLGDVIAWLEARGYRAFVPAPVDGTLRRGAILFSRTGADYVQMAMLGDTLAFDGAAITVL